MKADVHGSCVSFSILKKETEDGCQIKLGCLDNNYFFSHINIAGSMGERIDIEPTEEELSSLDGHLRRNLIADLNKSVVPNLLESDAEYLLIDFYDFGRVQWAYRNGSYTHTSFFRETEYWQKISGQIEGTFRWIDLPTFLWYGKVDSYFQRMVEKYGRDHIILNRISFNRYYIDKDNSMKEFRRENPRWLGSYRDNECIRNLEEHVIQKFGIQSIDVAKYFVSDYKLHLRGALRRRILPSCWKEIGRNCPRGSASELGQNGCREHTGEAWACAGGWKGGIRRVFIVCVVAVPLLCSFGCIVTVNDRAGSGCLQ